MPKTHTLATSRIDAQPFKRPPERPNPTSTLKIRGNRRAGEVLKIVDHIAGTDNVPTRLATEAKPSQPPRAGHSAAAPPLPEVVRWHAHWWAVPEEVRSNPGASNTHMCCVLSPHAIACSDYWQNELGGRPLSVLNDSGNVIFRIGPETKGDGSKMQMSDAVIKMTRRGPMPYDTQQHTTGQNIVTVDEFCSAAVRATLFHSDPLKEWALPAFKARLTEHEVNLKESMKAWVRNNLKEYKQIAHRLMGIETVEVDDRKESTHASNPPPLSNVPIE